MSWVLVGLVAVGSVFLPGAPAPQHHVPPTVVRPLPEVPEAPTEGCTVHVAGSLQECPGAPTGPWVSCVVPVGARSPGTVVPVCPRSDPTPQGPVVPVPLSR